MGRSGGDAFDYGQDKSLPGADSREGATQNRSERMMRLTAAEVERTLSQFEAQPIPDDHPVVPQLNSMFGDHTFFLDRNGLNIVEPTELPQSGMQAGRVINLANWSDPDLTSLVPHEPEPTDAIVELGYLH